MFINHIPHCPYIPVPKVQDIFETPSQEQKKVDNLKLSYSSVEEEKGSVFRAVAVCIKAFTKVKLSYRKVKHLFPESDHVMMAHVLKANIGWQDNGEYSAGCKVLQVILDGGYTNIAVFVTQKYGRVHLGPRRFMYIQKAAREALDKLQNQLD